MPIRSPRPTFSPMTPPANAPTSRASASKESVREPDTSAGASGERAAATLINSWRSVDSDLAGSIDKRDEPDENRGGLYDTRLPAIRNPWQSVTGFTEICGFGTGQPLPLRPFSE